MMVSTSTVPNLTAVTSIVPLRSTQHSELKNQMMMERLLALAWFLEYRRALALYRKGRAQKPKYPSQKVEEIERMVDAKLAIMFPGYVR
jgi:uncharacterized membrane-anchored protein